MSSNQNKLIASKKLHRRRSEFGGSFIMGIYDIKDDSYVIAFDNRKDTGTI